MKPGLVGLISAVPTPMRADGALNLAAVEKQAAWALSKGVTGVFVAGTTGESMALTVAERLALADRWVEAVRGTALKVVVHIGAQAEGDAVELARGACRAGAHAVAGLTPSYFKPAGIAELVDFLAPIAAAAHPLPFYYYDIPSWTGVTLPAAELLGAVRRRIPNFAGLKFTNADLMQLQECLHVDPDAFEVLFGYDEMLLAALALGVRGAVGSTYNLAPTLYHRLIAAFDRGDLKTARAQQLLSVRMIRALVSKSFLSALKRTMGHLGVDCGPVRAPLRNLSEEEWASVRSQLEAIDVLG